MGWMTRFEPATSGSTDRRSNQLSYIHHKSSIVIILIFGRFCQKNFPPRFCKPGRTDKQPLIKSAAAEHKNSTGCAHSSRHANPPGTKNQAGAQTFPSAHSNPTGHAPNTPIPQGARVLQGRAMQTPPGVARLFSQCRCLRGGQVAQALAHLGLCQHPFFRRPQAHL